MSKLRILVIWLDSATLEGELLRVGDWRVGKHGIRIDFQGEPL